MSDFNVRDVGVTQLQRDIDIIIKSFPKQAKQLLRKVGNKGKSIIAKKARQLVKKHTGYYHKKFKRGKVWQDANGSWKIRVYNNSPHAHLIEDGHRIVGKDGSEHGFQPGYKAMEKGTREWEIQMDDLLEQEIDKIFSKL